jgi:hypothetical protein
MILLLPLCGQFNCPLDVGRLGALVATAQQHHNYFAPLEEARAALRAVVDAQFAEACASRLQVARIAACQPVDAHQDVRSRLPITYAGQPQVECLRPEDLAHGLV